MTLQGGIFYHFTLDFAQLGSNGASLLIQGENVPKGHSPRFSYARKRR